VIDKNIHETFAFLPRISSS